MSGSYVTQYQDRSAEDPLNSLNNSQNLDEIPDGDDDGQSLIGISFGPEQTRLASPSATEEQKFAALARTSEDHQEAATSHVGFKHETGVDAKEDNHTHNNIPASSPLGTAIPPPTPWRAGPRSNWTITGGDSTSDDTETTGSLQERGNASDATREELGWRKYIPSLPSLPTLPQGFTSSSAKAKVDSPTRSPARSRAASIRSTPRSSTFAAGDSRQSASHGSQSRPHARSASSTDWSPPSLSSRQTATVVPSRPSPLRRNTSDGSLQLQRSLSRASSLGDDSRWINVQEQVNSRGKAIRDSIADSNLRLPRLTDLPSFNIGEALADFQASRRRSASALSSRFKRSGSPVKRFDQVMPAQDRSTRETDGNIEVPPPPGMTRASAEAHPNFTRALKNVKGDLVILGGYRGSILRSAQPPHRQMWVPVKVGLGIRKVNLEVGFGAGDEDTIGESVIPGGMLRNIGPVDISRRLFKRLTSCKNAQDGSLRVWDFGYDWRLSPHRLTAQLIKYLESLQCNSPSTHADDRGATVIAHSLGGLITRYVINKRPELVRGVVYAGTPNTCVNILGPLRNGDEVLLSSRVLTAQVNFSIRTSFALLPLDGKCFFNRETGERFDVDFFDPQQWQDYRWSPCVARPLPVNAKAQSSTIGAVMNSVTSALPSIGLPGRSGANSRAHNDSPNATSTTSTHLGGQHAVSLQMNKQEEPTERGENPETDPSTMVTVSKDVAMEYLTRTLAEVKQFKEELAFDSNLDAKVGYPPTAVIYGKAVPTVYGACVKDRESIKRADAYDNLAFASGDGVVLARAAQLPGGYRATKGGVVSSDRGHISLLGDLEAVGRCLNAIIAERKRIKRGEGKQSPDTSQIEEPLGKSIASMTS